MNNFQRWFRRLPKPLKRHKVITFLITLFPSFQRSELHFNGTGKLIANLADSDVRNSFKSAEVEPEFFEITSPMISDGGIFFDVGANFGWCSFGIYGQRPAAHIRYFLFEANPAVFECLKQSVVLNSAGDFYLTHGCVLDKNGFSILTFSEVNTGSGYFSGPASQGIPNVVLDQFIAEHQITTVDLLKIDIEGAEPYALEGARVSLSKGIIKAIYIEVVAEHLERQGSSPSKIFSVLRESGFTLFWCKPREFERYPELKRSSIRIRSNHGSFLVSPLETFPHEAQTDILALHRDTPLLARLIDCVGRGAPAENEVREVAI